jgi:predicted transport protein
LTQQTDIFSFLLKNPNARPIEISKKLKIPAPSVRRAIFTLRKEKILSKPVITGKNKGTVKIRQTKKAKSFLELIKKVKPKPKEIEIEIEIEEEEEEEEPPTIYRKILKIGASCAGKFKLIFAITFEDNEENRESELLAEIELDFKSCVAINYDGRELYSKKLKRDIEFGYAEDKTDDNFNVNEFYPNIRTGEEMI